MPPLELSCAETWTVVDDGGAAFCEELVVIVIGAMRVEIA
jgi:hypothetical protein